jgi:hypothetical protein
MHRNKGVKTKQSDDGIGNTLVSALEVPGIFRDRRMTVHCALDERECAPVAAVVSCQLVGHAYPGHFQFRISSLSMPSV